MKSIFLPPQPYLNKNIKNSDAVKNTEEKKSWKIGEAKKLSLQDIGIFFEYGKKAKRFKDIQQKISYKFIRNDNQQQSLIYLISARNLYHLELEKMDKKYISRLVFDRRHETLIIILDGDTIGGITFRLFDKFAEIVFCVVGSKFHTHGFGSYMMTIFKMRMQEIGILNIYTYADDTALVFFHRHGFSLHSHLPKSEWSGFLKDYAEATLLSCSINPIVDYLNIHDVLDHDIKLLEEKIGYSQIYSVDSWPVTQIGGIKIDGKQTAAVNENIRAALRKMRMDPKCEMFLKQPPFPEESKVTNIDSLMDFSKLTEKVKANKYKSFEKFSKDLFLVFETCLKYMINENTYTIAARELLKTAHDIIDAYIV